MYKQNYFKLKTEILNIKFSLTLPMNIEGIYNLLYF